MGAVGQVVVRRRAEAYGARVRSRTAAERERAPDWAAAPDADKRDTASRRAGTVPPLVTWVFSEGWNALERLRGGRACRVTAKGPHGRCWRSGSAHCGSGRAGRTRRWPAVSGSAARRSTGTARGGRCPRSSPPWSGWPACAARLLGSGRRCTGCGSWRTANASTGRGRRRQGRGRSQGRSKSCRWKSCRWKSCPWTSCPWTPRPGRRGRSGGGRCPAAPRPGRPARP